MPGKGKGGKRRKGGSTRSGGGKGRLGNMTEEERMIYLEQQRLAEEEYRKQREDFLSAYLQGKITNEEKFSRLNLHKLNHQWRNIMREAKSRELRKDIEILSQTFERVVDRKESVLRSLARDIEEADGQMNLAVRAHLQNVDRLVDIQAQRMRRLGEEYRAELETVREEFDSEAAWVAERHAAEMKDLQDVMFGMKENFTEKEVDARTEFHSMRDEIKNRNNEEKHALRVLLEVKVDEYWRQFNEAKKAYNEATREKKLNFENLKAKDEASAKEIDRQMRRLQKIGAEMSSLKQRMASNSRLYEERNRMLKEEREKMVLHFQQLKAQMARIKDQQRQRLTKMTLESNEALKGLRAQNDKADRILKSAEMCRRLETEEEKVLPFPASSLTPEEQEDLSAAVQEEPLEPLARAASKYRGLEEFWRRYNRGLLDKLALEKERSALQVENGQLRSLLKQYLDGVSVNEEVLAAANPLLVINGRSNTGGLQPAAADPRVRAAPTVTVEAGNEVRNRKA
ncbi:hypothetical protein BOX15_Mlig009998g1 [Macrostomum lignano]|uniref:Dynein regulatory complex subunit 2 n=2 Tax=Macrostomum lignano TaxID=282301 RepID=A0A1I8INW9_9PLAT|nr:hypothetical protein BOX15_Mlig009998g1 [Macrostomum lignano]